MTTEHQLGITQRNWRITGAVCLGLATLMAVLSPSFARMTTHWLALLVYGAGFTLMVLSALYIALLDLRFTRLHYKLSERRLFHETFMTEDFKHSVKDAQAKEDRSSGN